MQKTKQSRNVFLVSCLGFNNSFSFLFLNDNQLTRFEESIFKPILLKMEAGNKNTEIRIDNSKLSFFYSFLVFVTHKYPYLSSYRSNRLFDWQVPLGLAHPRQPQPTKVCCGCNLLRWHSLHRSETGWFWHPKLSINQQFYTNLINFFARSCSLQMKIELFTFILFLLFY